MARRIQLPERTGEALFNAITVAQNGDVIVVWSEWEKSIGEEVSRQRRPGLEISFAVERAGGEPTEFAGI